MNAHHPDLLMTYARREEIGHFFQGVGWAESKNCWVPPICQTLLYFLTMHKTLKINTNAPHFTDEETEAGGALSNF